MDKEIKFYTKSVYGNDNIYIADMRTKNLVATLTHKETINTSDMLALEELGFIFKEVLVPKEKGIPATMHHIFDR